LKGVPRASETSLTPVAVAARTGLETAIPGTLRLERVLLTVQVVDASGALIGTALVKKL